MSARSYPILVAGHRPRLDDTPTHPGPGAAGASAAARLPGGGQRTADPVPARGAGRRMQLPPLRLDEAPESLLDRVRKDPGDAHALHALRQLYRDKGDHAGLADLMESCARRLSDPERAADARVEAGDAALAAGDPRRAQLLYEQTLRSLPSHEGAARQLGPLLERTQQHERWVQWLQYLITALGAATGSDTARLAQLHCELGSAYERHYERLDAAVACYRQAIELDVTYAPAIVRAREIYRRAGNLRAAAVLYEFQIKVTGRDDDKVTLLVELAQLWAEQLLDLNPAIAALRRAAQLKPDDVELLDTLAKYLVNRAQSRQGERAEADLKRAAELFYLAAIQSSSVDAKRYLQAAARYRPNHAGVRALREALAAAESRAEAEAAVVRHREARQGVGTPTLTSLPPPRSGSALPPPPPPMARRSAPPPPQDEPHTDVVALPRPAALPADPAQARPLEGRATRDEAVPDDEDTLELELEMLQLENGAGSADGRNDEVSAHDASVHDASVHDASPSLPASLRTSPRSALVSVLPEAPDAPHVEVNVGPTTASNFYVGVSGQLQRGGVFVASYQPHAVGKQLALLITLPGGYACEAHGTVRFVREADDDGTEPGYGVGFDRLTQQGLALIERFAAKRPPMLY